MEDRFSGQEGSRQSGSVGGKRIRDRGLVGRDGLRGKYCVSGPAHGQTSCRELVGFDMFLSVCDDLYFLRKRYS